MLDSVRYYDYCVLNTMGLRLTNSLESKMENKTAILTITDNRGFLVASVGPETTIRHLNLLAKLGMVTSVRLSLN